MAWLWPQRRALGEDALALAREAWAAYTAPNPKTWASLADHTHPALPLLGGALARQLQELPGAQDGLSLTERLLLRVLASRGELPAGRVFGQLMMQDDPLPYLGDQMFHVLLQPLIHAPQPILLEGPGEAWAQRPLRLTPLAEQVLAGKAHWLDHNPAQRWVGGVLVDAADRPWVVTEQGEVWRR